MSWLVFIFALEAGFLPNYGFVMYQAPEAVVAEHSLYVDMEASVEIHGFYVGGGMRCYMWKTIGDIEFYPYQMTYRFDAGWRNEWLNIGFRHYCQHPVMPWMPFQRPDQNWEGAYEELCFRVRGRIGGKR